MATTTGEGTLVTLYYLLVSEDGKCFMSERNYLETAEEFMPVIPGAGERPIEKYASGKPGIVGFARTKQEAIQSRREQAELSLANAQRNVAAAERKLQAINELAEKTKG